MTPTAWDFRNKLLAILNGAKHSGKPYVDLESGNFYIQMGATRARNVGWQFAMM